MDWKDFSTMVFAGSSLVFAGLTFLYAKWTYDRDNYKLKIYILRMTDISSKKDSLMLRITNIGKSHTFITAIYFKGPGKNKYYLIREGTEIPEYKSGNYPYKISSGEEFVIRFGLDRMIKDFGEKEKRVNGICIENSLGKISVINIDYKIFPELNN